MNLCSCMYMHVRACVGVGAWRVCVRACVRTCVRACVRPRVSEEEEEEEIYLFNLVCGDTNSAILH